MKLYADILKARIATNIDKVTTSILIDDASLLPTLSPGQYFIAKLTNGYNVENVQCTSVSSNTLTVVRSSLSYSFKKYDKCIISIDPYGYDISSGGGGAVASVNGQTGVVVLDLDDITDGSTNKAFTSSEKTKLSGIESGAEVNDVDSVNSKTGTVVLTQDDIGDGSTYKQYSSTEKTKLSGIASGAQVNTVTSVAGKTGVVTLTADDTPDGTTNKAYTATEKTKLSGIASSADVTLTALAGSLTAVTVATNDKVIIQDTSNSNAVSTVTTQAVADLCLNTNVPMARAYRGTSDQTFTQNTATKIQLNTEDFDTNGWFDSSTNYRFTPLLAGRYLVILNMFVSFSGGGSISDQTQITPYVYKNGSSYASFVARTSGTSAQTASGVTVVSMNGSTDYIEMYGLLQVGTNLVFTTSSQGNNMTIIYLGP